MRIREDSMNSEETFVYLNRTQRSSVSGLHPHFAVYVLHSNIRVFASAIAALSKLGDELFLGPQPDGICLRAFDKTRSACGSFLFASCFFSSYDTKSLEESEARYCRVSMKTALSLFKSVHFVEKNLISCTLTVDCLGRELHIEFQQSYDVSRFFNVNIMEIREPFISEFNKGDMKNVVTINASEIAPFLNEMRSGNEELMICVQNDKFVFQNYLPCDDGVDNASACRTEITLQKTSFKKFVVRRQTTLCLCMREFKAFITFARQQLCDVSMLFDKPGSPLIVAAENDSGYSGEFIIATIESNCESNDGSPEMTQRPSHVHSDQEQNEVLMPTQWPRVQSVQEEQNEILQSSQRSCVDHVNELQSQAISQQSIPLTQPNPNHILDEEVMDVDELRAENIDEHCSVRTQFTCSHSRIGNSACAQKDTVSAKRHDVEKAKQTENVSLGRNLAGPSRKVNVEFQHRFLGIGVSKQNQTQASAAVNTIVEATQLQMGKK